MYSLKSHNFTPVKAWGQPSQKGQEPSIGSQTAGRPEAAGKKPGQTDGRAETADARSRNPGLSLLRIWMCFEVILVHFYEAPAEGIPLFLRPFTSLTSYAVPVFFDISFALTEKMFFSADTAAFRRRLLRLWIPLVSWAVIYYVVLAGTYVLLGKVPLSDYLKPTDLLWQILTGHSPSLNYVMWFQSVMLVATILLFLVAVLFRRVQERGLMITLLVILGICLLSEYSGWNALAYSGFRYELKYPLGRLAECLPCAIAGMLLMHYGIRTGKPAMKKGGVSDSRPRTVFSGLYRQSDPAFPDRL